MERIQIEQTVLAVLTAILKHPFHEGVEIARKNTPGWDSLKHIEIMFALEDELGIEFSEDELVKLDSAAKIIDAAQSKHAA